MNKIYTVINEKTGGKYADLRFAELAFDDDKAVVTVYCPADRFDDVKTDIELVRSVRDILALKTPVEVVIMRDELSPRVIRDTAAAFMHKFPFVASAADNMTVSADPPSVFLKMHKSMLDLAKDDFLPRLDEYFKNRFTVPVAVKTETVEVVDAADKPQTEHKAREYALSNVTPVYGTVDVTSAVSAADVAGYNEDIAVCGVLSMATDFMSKGGGAKRSRPYQKFVLFDGDGTLQCRFYPHDGFSAIDAELIGKTVVVIGNTEVERGRVGETSMTVRNIALCTADVVCPPLKSPVSAYSTVFPAEYAEYVQASLFGDNSAPSLKGTYVAFDFETTGLSVLYDSPTELGAVKIVDGVITETFSTLIDPRRPIPEEVSKKTGITDDMVKGKPLFEDVLPDFYRFSYGCALIGHNIAFDFPFLLKHGNRAGWAFYDRATFDTMGIAPRAVPGIEMLTLDNVLEKLSLKNDNAHRALSDATATAKAFIAMNKILYK